MQPRSDFVVGEAPGSIKEQRQTVVLREFSDLFEDARHFGTPFRGRIRGAQYGEEVAAGGGGAAKARRNVSAVMSSDDCSLPVSQRAKR